MKTEWKPLPDQAHDWMREDECTANHRGYILRLSEEVLALQGVILGFLEAWDGVADVVRMNEAVAAARRAIGMPEPENVDNVFEGGE
jgi:hypothetical protein